MKRRLLFITAFCLISILGYSQNLKPVYSLVEVPSMGNLTLKQLESKGFDIDFGSSKKDGGVRIIAHQFDLERLTNMGYSYKVIHEDLAKFQQKSLKSSTSKSKIFGQGSLGGYFSYEEFTGFIDSIQAIYPSIMSAPISIGQTHEGRDIIAYKISDNPEVDEVEPRSLITGLHHAREPMSFMASLYFTKWLLENYGTNEMATYIVNNREVWFVPIINVDGYTYNEQIAPNGGGMWRKNKRDNNENGAFNSTYDGVDLNRNYAYGWGYDDTGSSGTPSSETYRGPSAFSEPETEAIRQMCISKGFNTALNFHTFGDLFIISENPDGTTFPDHELFKEYGHDATKANGYIFGNGSATVQYTTNGGSDDWMYGEQVEKGKIMAFTPEIGTAFDYFWAPTDRILTLAEENLYPQQYMVMAAGEYLKIEGYSFNDIVGGDGDFAAEAGETVDLVVSVKNKGWAFDALGVTATLSCSDILVTINDNTFETGFDALASKDISFSITLAEGVESGHTTTINVLFTDANGYNLTETYEITFGKPFLKFFDSAENGLELWNADDTWGITDEKSDDKQLCFTDSPYGNYKPSSETALTLASPVNLSGLNNARLCFKTRYNMEKDFDMAQLQISTDNGATWAPLAGEYSTNGAGNDGLQPLNEPVYNGFRDLMWVNETVSLLPYVGQEVLFRFLIASDGGTQTDGWYIDDITVLGYTDEPTMPQIFSVTAYHNTDFQGPYPVDAIVTDDQGGLSINLFYSTNNIDFTEVEMQPNGFSNFTADIPLMELGTTVYYYIEVIDEDSNEVTSDVISFIVTNEPAVIQTNIEVIAAELAIGETEDHLLNISNSGMLPLTWSISGVAVESKEQVLVISDPQGDQTGSSPDIVAMHAELLGDNSVSMSLEFASSINPSTMLAIVSTDTDQNGETGTTGDEFFGYPGWGIGIDYHVFWDLGNQYGMGSVAFVTDETGSNVLGTSSITVDGNSMSAIIPLSYFANDDGNMNVAVICGSQQGYDAAPNTGHGTIGKPSVASWLNFSAIAGTVHASESVDINITLSAANVPPAIYQAEVLIESNDPANSVIVIPVTLTVLNNQANVISFSMNEQVSPATINEGNKTISIKVSPDVDVTNLVASFTVSNGATAFVGEVEQESGVTANNFTNPVVYTIIAQDGIVEQNWTVTVSTLVGIDEVSPSELFIYPNPAKDKLFISSTLNCSVSIFSIVGEKVLYIPSLSSQRPADISMLPSGMYIVNITENGKTLSKLLNISK